MSKGRLKDAAARPLAQRVLAGVLDGILRLVQPIMPFVAESIWQALNEAAPERGLPTPAKAERERGDRAVAELPRRVAATPAMETRFARMQELVRGVREVRNRYQVDDEDAARRVGEVLRRRGGGGLQRARPRSSARWPGIGNARLRAERGEAEAGRRRIVRPEFEAYVSLAGLIDVAAEIEAAREADRREAEVSSTARRRSWRTRSSWPAPRRRWCSSSASWWPTWRSRSRAMEENLKELANGVSRASPKPSRLLRGGLIRCRSLSGRHTTSARSRPFVRTTADARPAAGATLVDQPPTSCSMRATPQLRQMSGPTARAAIARITSAFNRTLRHPDHRRRHRQQLQRRAGQHPAPIPCSAVNGPTRVRRSVCTSPPQPSFAPRSRAIERMYVPFPQSTSTSRNGHS